MKLSGISKEVKTQAIAAAVLAYTGSYPIITRFADYNEISFTPEQAVKLQDTLSRWHAADPGEVRVNVRPVLLPFYLRKYWYWIAGTAVIGLFFGLAAKRIKR